MTPKNVAEMWYERVVSCQYGHYRAALYFDRRHWILGGANVALAAAIGTSVFATVSNKADLLVLTGALSVITALVAALQTFLNYGGRADRHRVAGASYGAVGRTLELALAKPQFDEMALEETREQLDKLGQDCPHIPEAVHKWLNRNSDRVPRPGQA